MIALMLMMTGTVLTQAKPIVQQTNYIDQSVPNEPSKCTGNKNSVADSFCGSLGTTNAMTLCFCKNTSNVVSGMVECPNSVRSNFNQLCEATLRSGVHLLWRRQGGVCLSWFFFQYLSQSYFNPIKVPAVLPKLRNFMFALSFLPYN